MLDKHVLVLHALHHHTTRAVTFTHSDYNSVIMSVIEKQLHLIK